MQRRFTQWNARWAGLPRKALLIAATLAAAATLLAVLPVAWPFCLAFGVSVLMRPLMRFAAARLPKLPRRGVAAVGLLLLLAFLGLLAGLAVSRLTREAAALARQAPLLLRWLRDVAVPWAQELYRELTLVLPVETPDFLSSGLLRAGDELVALAGRLSTALASGAVTAALSLPGVILSLVLTVMSAYYFTVDRERIAAFVRRTLPPAWLTRGRALRRSLLSALLGQLKSQLTVSLVITLFLVLTFTLFRVPYGLLMGLIIGAMDALPVVGAGLFLIPWCVFGFLTRDLLTGFLMLGAYVGTIILRNVLEPRIVGRNLGLYPVATMAALYAGYRLLGFWGLLAGPVLLGVLRAVLAADADAP